MNASYTSTVALCAPIPAWAQLAYTTQSVNVRAGPDSAFPLVTWLPARTRVSVVGCTVDERWCDVVSGRSRHGLRNFDAGALGKRARLLEPAGDLLGGRHRALDVVDAEGLPRLMQTCGSH